jgi:hypothetical protein
VSLAPRILCTVRSIIKGSYVVESWTLYSGRVQRECGSAQTRLLIGMQMLTRSECFIIASYVGQSAPSRLSWLLRFSGPRPLALLKGDKYLPLLPGASTPTRTGMYSLIALALSLFSLLSAVSALPSRTSPRHSGRSSSQFVTVSGTDFSVDGK